MKLDLKDIGAGLAISLFGLFFFVKSFDYGLGSAQRMGPGFFPMIVGALAVLMGLIIMVPAFRRAGVAMPKVAWRAVFAVIAAVAMFGIGLTYFGFVPAVFACILLCSLADPVFRPVQMIALASLGTLAFWLLFIVGLHLQIPAFGGV